MVLNFGLFSKVFVFWLVISLLAFGLTNMPAGQLLKVCAVGLAVSLAFSFFYPEFRGIKTGDRVAVVANGSLPFFSRLGKALSESKKQGKLRVQLENGGEAIGIVESYEGILSPPRIRLLYEEKSLE